MNVSRKLLAGFLILSGIMPLMAAVFSAFNQPQIMQMFNFGAVTATPELTKSIIIMGAAMIPGSIIQFIAAIWVWKGRPEGITLALWAGIIILMVSLYLVVAMNLHNISDPMLYSFDLAKGIIITALSLYARSKQQAAAPALNFS
jgi:hypothetical protein